MDILNKPNRATLKSYFVKNAIPTADNFADLIDGLINQQDDGIAKLPGEPLRLTTETSASETGFMKVLNFYKSLSDQKPAWSMNLNPRVDPANADTAKPGWSIGDADGNSKLFIDENTGNVGIGTVEPESTLQVNGSLNVHRSGAAGADLIMGGHAITLKGVNDPANYSPRLPYIQWRQADDIRAMYLGWGDSNAKHIDMILENGYKLNISGGNVGIGTGNPVARLEVNGTAVISNGNSYATKKNFMASGSLTVGSINANYGGGNKWNTNTAGLLLEAATNTEIAVHDSGTRVASLMYYEGDATNRITIGRDMGWGTAKEVKVEGELSAKSMRVTRHTASVPKAVAISKSNKWGDFPYLVVTFTVAQETDVTVFYGITMHSGKGSHIVTRMLLDNKELRESRSIAGNTSYWSPSSVWMGVVAAGTHTFKVQYRTPVGGTLNPGNDWHKGCLMVTAYGAG